MKDLYWAIMIPILLFLQDWLAALIEKIGTPPS
jgi:hypothetical protein